MKSPGKRIRFCQATAQPVRRAQAQDPRSQSQKSCRATEFGEPAAILLHSPMRSAWIGMLWNRIHIGQLFFLGPGPAPFKLQQAPGSKHENLGLGSSSAQLRIDNDFSLWCIILNGLCCEHDEFIYFIWMRTFKLISGSSKSATCRTQITETIYWKAVTVCLSCW